MCLLLQGVYIMYDGEFPSVILASFIPRAISVNAIQIHDILFFFITWDPGQRWPCYAHKCKAAPHRFFS